MSDHIMADVTPAGWVRAVDLVGSAHRLLFYSREASPHYEVRFQHRCDRGERGVIVCAPQLTATNRPGGHQIIWDASGNVLTVSPSILCDDCGTHGFVTNGKWVPA